jgi:hypothetical protein
MTTHTGPPSYLSATHTHIMPSQLVHRKPEHVADIIRVPRDITQSGYTYTDQSRELEIYLPKGEVLDFTRGWMEFDLALSYTGGVPPAYIRASNGIWSCVRRMELREGEKLIQSIDRINYLYSIMWKYTSLSNSDPYLGELYGIGSQLQRNAWGTVTRNYCMPFLLHSLSKIPIHTHGNIHRNRMKLRIVFDQATNWIECPAGINPGYTISNFRIIYEQVSMPPEFKSGYQAIHSQGDLKTHFDDFVVYEQPVTTANFSLHLTPTKQAVKSLFTIFLDDANRGRTDVDDKFLTYENPGGGIVQYHHRFQGGYYQEKPVICSNFLPIESYNEMLRWVGAMKGMGNFHEITRISPTDFKNGNSWITVVDLETSPHDPHLINNVSTTHEADIDIEFQLTGAPATNKVALTFVQFTTIWQHGREHSSIVIS